jgi:hypothetical protein
MVLGFQREDVVRGGNAGRDDGVCRGAAGAAGCSRQLGVRDLRLTNVLSMRAGRTQLTIEQAECISASASRTANGTALAGAEQTRGCSALCQS